MKINIKDLAVTEISDSLSGVSIDLVVSGSIAACESVRLVRALRRLGADITVWLTKGGQKFITPLALEWASENPVVLDFSGLKSHISEKDMLVVAPCTANFLAKMANGFCSSASSALATSYIGMKKPIVILPNMHQSMFVAGPVQKNLKILSNRIHQLAPRAEEGKLKFPEPEPMADEISFLYNSTQRNIKDSNIGITMGSTKGFIDDVRYLSNYSSGSLGSKISEELYRQGFFTNVVCGSSIVQPRANGSFNLVQTTEEMAEEVKKWQNKSLLGGIFCASVLDFTPKTKISGKVRSEDKLEVEFVPTKKIINICNKFSKIKIGFKLEPDLNKDQIEKTFNLYKDKYQLTHLIFNKLSDVSKDRHKAIIISTKTDFSQLDLENTEIWLQSKEGIAREISAIFKNSL